MKRIVNGLVLIGFGAFLAVQASAQPERDVSKQVIPLERSAVNEKAIDLGDGSEKRKRAYAKLFEGQRHLWRFTNSRSDQTRRLSSVAAKKAFGEVIALNPKLAEAFTGLAMLAYYSYDIQAGIKYSKASIALDVDNFGAHLVLARLYTHLSGLAAKKHDNTYTNRAIAEWEKITNLDARFAEAWAFLSIFYEKNSDTKLRIAALRKWQASATPIDSLFFDQAVANRFSLQPGAVTTELGKALYEFGSNEEALRVLMRAVAANPRDAESIRYIRMAFEKSDGKLITEVIEALRQASFANPKSQDLTELLVSTLVRNRDIEGAIRILNEKVADSITTNRLSAAKFQTSIGDIFADSNRIDDAIVAYRKALKIRGILDNQAVSDENKDFAIRVFDKMISALRKANRLDEADRVERDSKQLFGKS